MKEILDSYNITFEWEVPQGHRDYYIIVYNPIDEPHSQQSQQVSNFGTFMLAGHKFLQ